MYIINIKQHKSEFKKIARVGHVDEHGVAKRQSCLGLGRRFLVFRCVELQDDNPCYRQDDIC